MAASGAHDMTLFGAIAFATEMILESCGHAHVRVVTGICDLQLICGSVLSSSRAAQSSALHNFSLP
jgi:hypothetical protein